MKKWFILLFLLMIFNTSEGAVSPIVKSCREAAKLRAEAQGKTEGELRVAIQRDPNNPFLYFNLAVAHWYREEWAEMGTNFDRAYELAGDDIGKQTVLLQLFHEYEYDEWIGVVEERLKQLCWNTGGKDIPVVPFVAVKLGYQAMEKQAKERAVSSFEFAATINPNILEPHFALLKLYVQTFDSRLTMAASNIIRSIIENTYNQFFFFFNLYNLIIGTLFLTLMTFAFIMFFKHFRHTYHHILESFHKGMPNILKKILATLMVIVPVIIFLRFEDMIMLLTWFSLLGIAVTWIYMDKKERNVIFVYIIFLLLNSGFANHAFLVPFKQVASVLAFPWDYTSPVSAIIKAQTSPWDPELAQKIDQFIDDTENKRLEQELLFSKALLLKRGGYFQQAEETYQKMSFKTAAYYNNVANIYFVQGRKTEAKELYEGAISKDRLLAHPHYNLSVLLLEYEGFDVGPSTEAKERAISLNRELISRFIPKSSEHFNRKTIDVTYDSGYLWNLAKENFSNGNRELVSAFWAKGIKGNYSSMGVLASTIFVLILFILTSRQRGIGDEVISCTVCNKSICRKCRKGLSDDVVCPDCYQTLSGIKKIGMREHLKQKIKRKATKKQRILARLYSVVPAAGFIYRGFFTRGLIFMFIGFILLTLWYNWGIYLNRIPNLKYASQDNLIKHISFGIIIILYWISLMYGALHAKHKVKVEEELGGPEEILDEYEDEY